MQHDFTLVFETENEYWKRVLEIFEKNESYPKKKVTNRNLHHKFPKSFSKILGEDIDNDKDNLISLSLSDHFLVHNYYYLLAKPGFKQPMATAFTFMAKKTIKYITPETVEMVAKDYAEAKKISDYHKSQKAFERYKNPEERKKNREMKLGKPHPHKAGFQSEEKRRKISLSSKNRDVKPKSEFGKKFREHFNKRQKDDGKLYAREFYYYQKFGYCSWEKLNGKKEERH